jgi:hypothetical protein
MRVGACGGSAAAISTSHYDRRHQLLWPDRVHGRAVHRGRCLMPIQTKMRALVVTIAASLTIASVAATPAAAFYDRDCGDFPSRKKAQRFFKNHRPNKDPHNLDADHDGRACETYNY